MKVKDACLLLGRKAMTNLDSVFKSRDITFLTKVCIAKSVVFSCSHVAMWELDHKEGWCFPTVLEKTLESPTDCKEIKPVNPEGNPPWIFIGRIDTEVPILWTPDVESQFTGKDWCWERLRAKEEGGRGWDGWMAPLTQGRESEQTLGDSEGQGNLVCCSLLGHRESDTI